MNIHIQDGISSKTYTVTSACNKPRIAVAGGGYIPLTTSTSNGLQLKAQINGQTYRAMEFISMSESGTFYTTMAQSEGLSSVTALTRESISGYATRSSTSATLTRSSTSATLTRSSTSATLTRSSTSATLTRSSTSATLTRSSTSATLTRSSTSATLTRSSISGYGTRYVGTETLIATYFSRTNYHRKTSAENAQIWLQSLEETSMSGGYRVHKMTSGFTATYTSIFNVTTATSKTLCRVNNGNGWTYVTGTAVMISSQEITVGATGSFCPYYRSNKTANTDGQSGSSYTPVAKIQGVWNGTAFYNMTGLPSGITGLSTGDTSMKVLQSYTNTEQTYFIVDYYSDGQLTETMKTVMSAIGGITQTTATYTRSSISGYGTRSSISNYGTRSSISGYGTRSSISGYGTRSSISGYGTRSSISGYGTRSSISGYGTRASTSATLTCASTSAYSGVSSSSYETSGWI